MVADCAEVGEEEYAKVAMESVVERIEPIPAGGAPQDSRLQAPGGVVARVQEEVAKSTMAIPTKVAGVRVEMRAVARVRLRRLQGRGNH